MNTQQNIILLGPMGAGKSSAGKVIARELGRDFIDLDALIEQREGRSIPEIFAERGEPYFRDLESAVCREVAAKQGLVVAAGGGVVVRPENTATLSSTGMLFCLRASADTILARVAHETHRPLLQGGDKREKIQGLLDKRKALYDAIPNQVDTEGLSATDVARRILSKFTGR